MIFPFDGESASNFTQNPVSCMQAVLVVLQKSAIPDKTADTVLSAWRSGTSKAHNTYVKRWVFYCCQRGWDPLQPTVTAVVQFLTMLYEEGTGHNSLKIASCAICTFSFGRDMKGRDTPSHR